MITICHPVDDLELLLLRAALDAAGIPFFVAGENFGSLYPGLQIPAYNERRVQVPAGFAGAALEVVAQLRASYAPTFATLTTRSKLRMLLEALWFGWVMPVGSKRRMDTTDDPGIRKQTLINVAEVKEKP